MPTALRFEAPDRSLLVTVSSECIEHWTRFRQTQFWHRESGGLMFAPSVGSTDGCVDVTTVTGPHSRDRGRRYSLSLDHERCLADIASQFEHGLHFVGYWHTHPEPVPTLSGIDWSAFARNLRFGGLVIERMIAVVVGNARNVHSVRAYLIDKDAPMELTRL